MARYSYSKLGTYASCPLQYRFRYVDRVRVDVAPSIEAFMGSRVHDALEWLYKEVDRGRVPTEVEVLAAYDACWDARSTGAFRIVDGASTADAYRAAGRLCLSRYVARHAPFDDGIVLGLEVGFEIPVEGKVVLHGFIDRLVKANDGTYEVHDYKTGRRLPTPEEAQADEQGSWYALAVWRRFPSARVVRLLWHYLRFDEVLTTERTPDDAAALERSVLQRIRAIEATDSFPAHESGLCSWCDFVGICPAKGHRAIVAGLAPNAYRSEPGVVLVNRLAEMRARRRREGDDLAKEIALVEEALVAYAREHSYSVIVGDDVEAVLSESAVLSLPTKDGPRRPALETAVRQLGLWDEVSELSLPKRTKALAEDRLPGDVRRAMEPFAAPENRTAIRLRAKRETVDR